MVGFIVPHVTALAQRTQVGRGVTGRIVVQVGRSQHDTGLAQVCKADGVWNCDLLAVAAAPVCSIGIEPASVWEALDCAGMRALAMLAASPRTGETDPFAELDPINRIIPA